MIEPGPWQAYQLTNPVLFHVTPEQNMEAILRDGLRPGSEVEQSVRDDFFRARPGHVYLINRSDIPIVEVYAEPRAVAVDLSALDPALVDPDEDMVKDRFPDIVTVAPPHRECDAELNELPGQDGALARWADTTPDFDRSEVTERSLLEGGRISYRGTIPASAISELWIPSDPLARFEHTLHPDLRHDLAPVPHRSHWATEIERGRALAQVTAEQACMALGHPCSVDLSDYHKAQAAEALVRGVAIDLFNSLRLEAGQAAGALQDALDLADQFTGHAPVSDINASADLAGACADALNQLAHVPDLPAGAAAAAARTAMQAGVDAAR